MGTDVGFMFLLRASCAWTAAFDNIMRAYPARQVCFEETECDAGSWRVFPCQHGVCTKCFDGIVKAHVCPIFYGSALLHHRPPVHPFLATLRTCCVVSVAGKHLFVRQVLRSASIDNSWAQTLADYLAQLICRHARRRARCVGIAC